MRALTCCLILYCCFSSIPTYAATVQTRISRPTQVEEARFNGISSGISMRWWRKFKNPAFCPFIICNGSCADISGQPRIGSYSSEELQSDLTPCSLSDDWIDSGSTSCCMNKTIKNTYETECTDGCCSSKMVK